MNILITGSEGLIGKIISPHLSKVHNVIGLDKKTGVDLIENNFLDYFKNIEVLIHLAANPNPSIDYSEAQKNIEIVQNIIQICDYSKNLKKIINASSINVYPFLKMFDKQEKIDRFTLLSPNTVLGNKDYGKAKIKSEKLFKDYCQKRNISLLNLRIGYVTENNQLPIGKDLEPFHQYIHLKHSDLLKIIDKGLISKGIEGYVCVSEKNNVLMNEDIIFPI